MDTRFEDKRRRLGHRDEIIGQVVDATEFRSHVDYDSGKYEEPRVNWSAKGSVPVEEARRYAAQILAACDAAEVSAREFEPEDEVTFDGLSMSQTAFVAEVLGAPDDIELVIEYGTYGDEGCRDDSVQSFNCGPDEVTRVLPDYMKEGS